MKALIGAMLMVSTGCTAAAPADPGVPAQGGGACNAAPAQKLVGRAKSNAAGAEAKRLSGARTLRWIPKDGIVTMDYREDRLNLHLDGRKKIVRVNCG
jgi:hypothetical protein